MDRVETHNISTQTFEEVDVGATKVAAIQDRVFRTVGVEIEAVYKELTKSNIKKHFRDTDLVVDGFDNSKSRQLVYDYCKENAIPCFHAGLHTDYGEAVWNSVYRVPQDADGEDVCDYPLARNLITLTVGIASEEILDYCLADAPRHQSWCITLKDLRIGQYS
jgi:molybdopterin/thiamine biosynthesis adenylyltransferase